ncbi:MAG: beta-ketoacyl synthase chain length factor [Myxococcota bacterium]
MKGRVAVTGWSAFVPGFASLADFVAERPSAEHDAPTGALVPLRERRRASPLSRALADAYAGAIGQAALDPKAVASVFGSALGEVSTMIALLDQMWSAATPLSPMKFATSVHNAASGMISIATANRGFTTSLGADYDTPAMGLFEGIAFVQSHGVSAVVCCGDEAPPENLVPPDTAWSLLSVAIALCPVEQAPPGSPQLSALALGEGDEGMGHGPVVGDGDGRGGHDRGARGMAPIAVPAMATALGRNPNAGLFDLAVALERGAEGRLRLDRGRGRGYSICVHRAPAA